MKILLRSFVVLFLCLAISGCGLLCQAGTGTCGMSKEQRYKLLHPKGYGEYFTKPGMTKEGWRQDWVACGGMADGGYAVGERQPGETDDFANLRRKTKKLRTCMQSKDYEYRREP